LDPGWSCPKLCSETVTVVAVAWFSASAAVAIAGNATAAHCADGEHGGNSSARPIDVTNGRTLADDCIGCASATIGCGGPRPA
jgi:spore maturation protein SpmB